MTMKLFITLDHIEELCEDINVLKYGQITDSLVAIAPLLDVVNSEQANIIKDRLIGIRHKIDVFLLSEAVSKEQRDYYTGIIEGIYKIIAYILA